MKKRIVTGAVLMAVLIPLIVMELTPVVTYLFLAVGIFLSVVATYEILNMYQTKYPTIRNQRFIVPVFSGILVYVIYRDVMNYQNLVIPLYLLFVIIILGITIFTKHSDIHDMMGGVMALTYAGLIMGYVISLRYIDISSIGIIRLRGGRSFGYVYSIVLATDIFAYLIGSKFGKRKLCPEISPRKTIEGAIGGFIAGSAVGVASAFLFYIVNPTDTEETILCVAFSLLISMLLSFSVQIGDLVASKMKRSFEVKDFGWIFPGHGGVLDRFDSLIYAGAVYYMIAEILQILEGL